MTIESGVFPGSTRNPSALTGDGPRIKSGVTGERSEVTGERSEVTGERSGATGARSGVTVEMGVFPGLTRNPSMLTGDGSDLSEH